VLLVEGTPVEIATSHPVVCDFFFFCLVISFKDISCFAWCYCYFCLGDGEK